MATLIRIQHAPGILEFRVQPHRTPSPARVLLLAIVAYANIQQPSLRASLLTLLALGWLVTPRILHESLLVFQHLGVQIETSRGWLSFPFSTTSEFIPAAAIKDIVINEALSAWQFKHYLAILQSRPTGSQGLALSIVFKNILPPVTLLSDIYRHVHSLSAASRLPDQVQ